MWTTNDRGPKVEVERGKRIAGNYVVGLVIYCFEKHVDAESVGQGTIESGTSNESRWEHSSFYFCEHLVRFCEASV